MPRHDVECQRCGTVSEVSGTDGTPCPRCGSRKTLWAPGGAAPAAHVFKPHWNWNLGHTPVYVESVNQMRTLLKERGLHVRHAVKSGVGV